MNLRDLQYLVAVADKLHFGRAAESCNVSQPTLSMQLKKLEESLKVQLFERSNKQVMITPIGERIVARARRVLQESDEIRMEARAAQDPLAGDLSLGAFPTLAPYLLPLIAPVIHTQLPKLKLWLVEEKTAVLLERLKTGALDAVLVALPIHDDALETLSLLDDPFYLAVPPAHPLAKRKNITQEHIRGEELLLLEDGHCLRSQALEVCGLMGASAHQELRATSLETLRQMVASGVGITLIPKLALRENDTIVTLPFASHAPSRIIGLVWRKRAAKETAILALSEAIRTALTERRQHLKK